MKLGRSKRNAGLALLLGSGGLAAVMAFSTGSLSAAGNQGNPAKQAAANQQAQGGQSALEAMAKNYTPELRQKLMALSPETKKMLMGFHATHTRRSDTLTLRQIMDEILADYQTVVAGVATDNAEMAADAARRLANHRIPKGGLAAYFPLEKFTDEGLKPLEAMNAQVEGSALKLAEAAEKGDMLTAASMLSEIGTGCVACHQIYRGQPGISPHLVTTQAAK